MKLVYKVEQVLTAEVIIYAASEEAAERELELILQNDMDWEETTTSWELSNIEYNND